MNKPNVSVCISTYNRLELLKCAIQSVIDQTYSCWELIICDDGSTDDTKIYVPSIEDYRIRYIRHPQNIGKSNNMRSGFEVANGNYFIKFDDDDRLDPNFLARTVEILDRFPGIDFVGTDHWIIDDDNTRDNEASYLCSKRWGRDKLKEGIVSNLLEVVFVEQSFYIGATLFRRKSLQDVEYMRPNMQNCEDSDLFVRLALAGKNGYYLPERLMEYRFHSGQRGLNRGISFLRDQIAYLESYQFESTQLESVRQHRLAKTKLLLGICLIELEQLEEGRKLVLSGCSASYLKAAVALLLTLLNQETRTKFFHFLHHRS